jgi:hypothetical protein
MPRPATKKTTSSTGAKRGRPPSSAKRTSGFARLVNTERKRLQKLRDKVHARKVQIDRELAELERDLQAMGAFVLSSGRSTARAARASAGARAGRGQRRQQVLDTIKSAATGATRGEIIEKLSAKGDKSLEQSISNVLAALFKSKAVKREDGRYRAS